MIIGKGVYLTIRHPDWFITGKIDSDVLSKNDVNGHNTKSILANSQNDILIDSNNEEYITDTNVRPLIKSRNDISDSLNGITYNSLLSGAESRILINQNIDGKAHITRLGKVNTDILIEENAETLKTANPRFTKAKENIATEESVEKFKTLIAVFDKTNDAATVGENTIPLKTETVILSEERNSVCFSESIKDKINNSVFSSVKNAKIELCHISEAKIKTVAPSPFVKFINVDTIKTSSGSKTWSNILQYSIDGETWYTWNGSTILASYSNKEIWLRGTGNTRIDGYWNINGTSVEIEGNLEALIDYAAVRDGEHSSVATPSFSRLFASNQSIAKADKLIIDAPNANLYGIFEYCNALIAAPDINSQTLNDLSYAFRGCSNLTNAPKIKATAVTSTTALGFVFQDCSNLETIPAIYISEFGSRWEYLCNSMFNRCSKIKFSETQSGEYVYSYRIPYSGVGNPPNQSLKYLFLGTGGAFIGDGTLSVKTDTTYYTPNEIIL